MYIILTLVISMAFSSFGQDGGDAGYCDKSIEASCYSPSIQFDCPVTCGTLEAKCKDKNKECLSFRRNCDQEETIEECPRTCGKCDECEDSIKTDFCEKLTDRCTEPEVQYSCRKTCGICGEYTCTRCYDAIIGGSCGQFKENEYCDKSENTGCKKTCGQCKEICRQNTQ